MSVKLIVDVLALRDAGWQIPRYQHAFKVPSQGVLLLQEERLPAINRHALVASLRNPETGALVPSLAPLYDARVIRATPDEWVLTGFERVRIGLKECDCAQTWRVLFQAIQC